MIHAASPLFSRLVAAAFAVVAGSAFALPDLESHPGRAVYQKLCLDCHGAKGEGDDKGEVDPLEGKRDIASLAGKIVRTMPEDKEHLCVGEDAKNVAEYIYHAFYSAEARARLTPARVELQRLTVSQYRASVSDVIGSFRDGSVRWVGEGRGIRGHYYGTRSWGERKELREQKKKDYFQRTDPLLKFNFGETAPKFDPEMNFQKQEFSVRWEAVLLPPETGKYEFVIRTRNGVELYVNERETEVSKTIDGYVAPDNKIRELKGSVFLIGGRPVPLMLQFFKYKEKAAYIELLWKTPHGVLEPIPTSNMTPDWIHEEHVVTVPFPADDRSVGYERGTAVSKAWLDSVTAGAIEASEYVVGHLNELARVKKGMPEKERWDKTWAFCEQFVARAFRRPLSDEEKDLFVTKRFDGCESPEQAAKRVVLVTLKDPRFLYPALSQRDKNVTSWDRAGKLAAVLWDSVTAEEIRKAVQKGELRDRESVEKWAWWMVSNPRAQAKLRGFFEHWLELDRVQDISKDHDTFPDFDQALLADLRTSLDHFIDSVMKTDQSDYRELLQADYLFLNDRLAKVYAPDKKIEPGKFEKVGFDSKQRSGLITHPFLLTSFAYHNNTSPIHRGVFLTRNIVGMSLNSPEMANEFVEGNFNPNLTMREKVADLTRAKACMACHTTINPLGFSLEHYDGIGRWRTTDKNKPIESSSEFKTDSGETIKLTGARDVAKFAANRKSAHKAFIEQLFHHMVKQPMVAYGTEVPDQLLAEFTNSGFNIRHLMVKIAMVAAMDE